MRNKGLFFILCLLVTMTACSTGETEDPESEEEFSEELESVSSEEEEDLIADDGDEEGEADEELDIDDDDDKEEEEVAQAPSGPGGVKYYTVKKNDTLMWVSFKVYGNYGKWRSIARLNNLTGRSQLKKGTRLKYNSTSRPFVWRPKGDPYLIKYGDTLGKISRRVYGSQKRWKSLWNNNKPMIKDPNLIFAGFTMYYLPLKQMALY